jgi:uncharacterized protein (DUF1499 family)
MVSYPLPRASRLLIILFAVAALLASVLAARLYLGRDAEDRIDEEDVIDFPALPPTTKQHSFLMCPEGVCNLHADAPSPVFDMEWERLRTYWGEVIGHQPRVKLIAGDGELKKITYIQHTAILRFPDIITIEFFPVGEHGSSFAIESHARYGYSDLGVNRKRVLEWVALLQNLVRESHDS